MNNINEIYEICAAITGKYDLFLTTTLKGLGIVALTISIIALAKTTWESFKND